MTEQAAIETYKRWAEVPDNLRTKTQLNREGLRLAPRQPHVAKIRTGYGLWKLYDVAQAIPKRKPTEAQLAHLEAMRQRALDLRHCGCGRDYLSPEDYGTYKMQGSSLILPDGQYRCRHCRDHDSAVEWAKGVLSDEGAIILDTETTGLDETAEIIEIAIIRVATGEVLLNTLVKPFGPMGATHIHGLTLTDVAGAPSWPEVKPRVLELAKEASRVIVYNAEYDRRLINQTGENYGFSCWDWELDPDDYGKVKPPITWDCAMEAYAEWVNDWSSYHKSYRWQRLEGGDHRALGDCLACLEYIKRMANDERH